MTFTAGTKLGPYEILSPIGSGGQGEVYKARDTRLNRTVAIKILPAHFSDNAEMKARFEREAQTIAGLNHPHICVLYDVGHQDGTDYLVMEYLEGQTLAKRLTKGPLPLDQVFCYGIEIADALDKAHRKSVTHRDLKPGNIMITKSGAKLLDFGLAKLRQETKSATPLSELSTVDGGVTVEGMILGTLQYMAPEQVEAKHADARTDIFAFGVMIYEMTAGKKAFEGKTQASLIAKILETDPMPMSSLQPMAPPALDRVVKRCLAKDPDDRWQTARDVCEELKWISAGDSPSKVPSITSAKSIGAIGRRRVFAGAGALLLVVLITTLAVWNLKPLPSPRPVTRTVITLPPGQQLAGLDQGVAVALSPDGTHLAYVARQGSPQQLYLRALDSLEARPLPGTEGAENPFFSPDGQWLGFFAGGKLKKVSVAGGAALTLADGSPPRGAIWGSQGMITFATASAPPRVQQVPDSGGTPQELTRAEKGETDHGWPEFLPGDQAMLFAAGTGGFSNVQVAVQLTVTGERRNLIQGATHPRYTPSGHLIYAQGGSLMAIPFDPRRLAVTGTAVPVVEGVLQSTYSGAAQYSFSATGSLVYVSGTAQATAQRRLVWVGRNGEEQPLAAPVHQYRNPRLSPDGRRLALTIDEQETQVWLYDLSRETLTRLTFEGNDNIFKTWTPDGKRIAFLSNKDGPQNIFWQLADGSGGLERLTTSKYSHVPVSWSPDGQLLAFFEINPTTGADIWVLHMVDRKAQPFLQTRFNEADPRFSPDGRWLAYTSDESGRYEIYVQPYPGPGGKRQISTEGGTEPLWNPSGRELFYRNGDKMMAVEIDTQPSFAAGTPRMLFEGRYERLRGPIDNYDVSPDGQRFLMLKADEQTQAPTQINLVLNWFTELQQRVPVK